MTPNALKKMDLVELVDYAYDKADVQVLAQIVGEDGTEEEKRKKVLALVTQGE